LENILRIFQIKQSLSNQVGECWSFYFEHTHLNQQLVLDEHVELCEEEMQYELDA
jgi:hypothetical protein